MRKKHKNEIFNFLSNTDLGKENFEIEEINDVDLPETIIVYKNSPFKFKIRTSDESFDLFDYQFVTFSPSYTLSDLFPSSSGWANFDEVFKSFQNWIKNHVIEYIEEINMPDLWSTYINGDKSLSFERIDFGSQENFSFDEKSQIKMALNELKFLIHQNISTTEQQQQIVNTRLEYLIDSTNRLNKFDWKSVSVSTIMSITVALSLDTSKGQLLFDLFKKVFSIMPILIK